MDFLRADALRIGLHSGNAPIRRPSLPEPWGFVPAEALAAPAQVSREERGDEMTLRAVGGLSLVHGPNWQNIDIASEGLLEIGLKPIYTTCFRPAAFTDGTDTCWPDGKGVSPPRDLGRWAEFVEAGVRHHAQRFGREQLHSWYLEVWNE